MFGNRDTDDTTRDQWAGSRKEWHLIEKVVMANTAELRKQRRWGIFFKLMTFVYLFALLWLIVASRGLNVGAIPESTGGHTAVVEVAGLIAADESASADNIFAGLQAALDHPDTQALILRINSGGGSPVQSAYVYQELRRLREEHPDIPINAVIVDTGASGAYYIASGAENIYANGASLVGSIGVTAAGFGFTDLMDKVGVERRDFTAGDHKAFMDPFQDVDPEEQALFQALLDDVHQQFITDVKAGRGDRLSTDNEDLFSGLVWTGQQAQELGLIDGLKSTSQLARELGYPRLIDFTRRPSPWRQFAKEMGVGMAEALVKLGVTDNWSLK